METNNKENWELAFDEKFGDPFNNVAGNQKIVKTGTNIEEVKDFISSTLSSSKAKWKEELVGKIEQIKKSPKFSSGVAISEEYNQALQDCIEIIKEL